MKSHSCISLGVTVLGLLFASTIAKAQPADTRRDMVLKREKSWINPSKLLSPMVAKARGEQQIGDFLINWESFENSEGKKGITLAQIPRVVLRSDGVGEYRTYNFMARSAVKYSFKGQIFCIRVEASPLSYGSRYGGVAAAIFTMDFYDDDQDGIFETLEYSKYLNLALMPPRPPAKSWRP